MNMRSARVYGPPDMSRSYAIVACDRCACALYNLKYVIQTDFTKSFEQTIWRDMNDVLFLIRLIDIYNSSFIL